MTIEALRPAITEQSFGARPSPKQELRAAAEAFEAMFLEQTLREGRESGFGPSLLDSSEGDTFRQMLDAEQAKEASGQLDLGIADALFQQLSPVLKG